MTEYKEYR